MVVDLAKVGYTAIHGQGVAKIVMTAPGPAIRFVGTHFKSADPKGFGDSVWNMEKMPIVDGLAISAEHPQADGIEAIGTMQLTITKTHIRGVRHGIRLVENNRNLTISDCHIYENSGIGIYYDNVNLHQSNITGCHISYNAAGGVVSKGGNVRNIHITGCDIESNMSPKLPPTANVLIDCRNSRYGTAEVAITGCTIQHNNPSPGSANVRMIGSSEPRNGKPVREGNLTMTGNVFSDVKVNVHLQACRGVVISGNTFWQGYEHNLLVENSSNIVLGPNNFDRNPRYDYGNTQEANNGIAFRDCQDCTLNGIHVTNVWRSEAGLAIENCRRMNITNCTILDCDNAGLLLRGVKNSLVSGCLIQDSRNKSIAVKVEKSESNLISNNLTESTVDN